MKKTVLTLLSACTTAIYAQNITVTELGRFTDGRDAACEIAAYDSASAQLFVTNAVSDSIDIIDISDPASPVKTGGVSIATYGGDVNSVVSLNNGFFAAAVEGNTAQDSGYVLFFTTSGTFSSMVKVGALPDMVTVTKDGNKVLVACEGEPSDDYLTDPEGAIGIIDISGGVAGVTQANVKMLRFTSAPGVIAGSVHKPGTTWAEDLEPEYIAVSDDNSMAFVVCQEANVLILVDLQTDAIAGYKGLGFKDHSVAGQGMDVSNRDDEINIATWNVKGIYMPDAISSYTVDNAIYVLSANEGDGRDYSGYSSETRIKDLTLDATAFPNAAELQEDSALGRLKTLTHDVIGDADNDNDIDELYSYGARSFSIWDASGNLVWDSGDEFEQYIATNFPDFFNCDEGDVGEKDERSDDKGPEPEAITSGQIGSKYFAFIGLERQGGIMVYDITDPNSPVFETFIHTYDEVNGTMTDIAPEGLVFVKKSESHTGSYLLIASNEVSGTTTIYGIEDLNETSVNEVDPNLVIKLYPNPSNGELTVFVDSGMSYYQLSDATGRVVQQAILNNGQNQVSIHNLPNGLYFMNITGSNGEKLTTQKVIKY